MIKAKEVFKVGENKIGWVDSDFKKEYGDEEVSEGKVLTGQKLGKNMTCAEMIKEFDVQECTLGDVLATIQNATEDMKDGWSNLFFIKDHPSRVVVVTWSSGYGGWGVRDWSRGDRAWLEDNRVFSPATGSSNSSSLNSESLKLEESIKIVKAAGYKIIKEF